MKAVLAAVAAVCAVAAAGCSGGRGAGAGGGRDAPAPATDASGLAPRLLTVADLPLGFQAAGRRRDAAALGCAGIDGVYLPAGASQHAAVSFAHSLSSAFVNETMSVRPGRGGRGGADPVRRAAATTCAAVRRPGRHRVPGDGGGAAPLRRRVGGGAGELGADRGPGGRAGRGPGGRPGGRDRRGRHGRWRCRARPRRWWTGRWPSWPTPTRGTSRRKAAHRVRA